MPCLSDPCLEQECCKAPEPEPEPEPAIPTEEDEWGTEEWAILGGALVFLAAVGVAVAVTSKRSASGPLHQPLLQNAFPIEPPSDINSMFEGWEMF